MAEEKTTKVQVPEKPKHSNIHAALSAFQGELKPMEKTGHVRFAQKNDPNKFVDFRYTPLGEIMVNIYPLLAKHGLSVRHELTEKGIEAILTHETYKESLKILSEVADGGKTYVNAIENEIRSGIVKISTGGDMKDTGAAITYARRYTLTMVLGISSEDDKDAELLEQSAKNAIQTVYDRFKAGVEKATTVQEVEKSMGVIKKDLEAIEKKKAPALGLKKEQYEALVKIGDARIDELNSNQTNDNDNSN